MRKCAGSPANAGRRNEKRSMIKRTEKLVITFYTTTAAMAMEHSCKQAGMDGRLIPVPGSISADCGLAWCAGIESEPSLMAHMQDRGIEYQGVYRCMI